jgi:hypothetical protein
MLSISVGLVDMTGTVDTQTMAEAAAALNIQVTRDLPQFWPTTATVSYLADHRKIPQGVWPVQIVKSLPPGEGGFHSTRHNQPFAKIAATPGSNEWTVDASHEILEMLVDPSGNRLQTSTAIDIAAGKIQDSVGQFEYLVEACDPCEADPSTYQIAGVSVSDFITPNFYDRQATPGTRYSFTGAIKVPRQILPGGYISFIDPQSDRVMQILWVNPDEPPQLRDLGPANGASLRIFVDGKTRALVREKRAKPDAAVHAARMAYREKLQSAAEARAKHYD